MKKIVLVFSALAMMACNSKDCKSFQQGRYKLIGDQAGDVIVERTGDVQIETSVEGDFKHEFNIRWVDDCNYELVFLRTNKPSMIALTEMDTLKVEIVSTEGNTCNTIARFEDLSFEVKQERIN